MEDSNFGRVIDPIRSLYHTIASFNPLPDDKILDRSKLKQSADDNFKLDENSRKFSKWVENTVGKGEITSTFSFSHSVFKRLVSQGRQKVSLCGNGLRTQAEKYFYIYSGKWRKYS